MVDKKILNIMSRVKYLAKDDTVAFGNTKYKALSEEKVTTLMRAEMVTEGLIVYPVDMTWTREGNISHVDVKYRIVDTDDNSFIEVVSCGDGYDTQDKGAGKAMTYAFKYMWLRTFAIPTGDDPDKGSSDEIDANEAMEKVKTMPISQVKIDALVVKCNEAGVDVNKLKGMYGVASLGDITEEQYRDIANSWSKKVVPKCKAV